MPNVRVTRVETRSGQSFGVLLGRSGGRDVYLLTDRDDAEFYQEQLAGLGDGDLVLNVPAWRLSRVEDVPR
jgi:hypothetical protein